MSARDNPTGQARAPLHLWIVGGAGMLWNGWGCYDYVMTNVRDTDSIARLPPDVIDYLDALTGWVIVAWAMAVGFALLGSLLLLGRSLWAVHAFALSLLGLAAMQAYALAIGVSSSMNAPIIWTSVVAIWLTTVSQLFYVARMRANGTLR